MGVVLFSHQSMQAYKQAVELKQLDKTQQNEQTIAAEQAEIERLRRMFRQLPVTVRNLPSEICCLLEEKR